MFQQRCNVEGCVCRRVIVCTHPWGPVTDRSPVWMAHPPRRIDWYRVAALTIVVLSGCAAVVALGAALAYVLTAF